MFIHLRERETEHEKGREGREREGDTESKTGPRLCAVRTEPNTGLELTNREIVTWAQVRRLTNWATHAPPKAPIFKYYHENKTAWIN